MKLAYLYDHNYINFTRYKQKWDKMGLYEQRGLVLRSLIGSLFTNRFGFKPPVHVSIICEPMERKLRHFYTERHNYRNWAEDFPIATTKWWRQVIA